MRGGRLSSGEEHDTGEDEQHGDRFAGGHGLAQEEPPEDDGGSGCERESDGFDARDLAHAQREVEKKHRQCAGDHT